MSDLILVSGLARCGTSLMMQMLSAGGWPVFDPKESKWPAFEHMAQMGRGTIPIGASGLMKWLDPQRFAPPRVRGSILLSRDNAQQGRSFFKLYAALGFPMNGNRKALIESLRTDLPHARAVLAERGPVLPVTFEDLVTEPRATIETVVKFIGDPLNIDAAVAQLRPRATGTACLPYLLEEQMIAERA